LTAGTFRLSIVLSALLALALFVSATPAFAKTPGAISGYDVSYPQCAAALPRGGDFGIVGVNDGIAWSSNACLVSEYSWAAARPLAPAFYMNTANPGPTSSHWALGGPQPCSAPSTANDVGCAYDYGWNAAAYAFSLVSETISPAAALAAGWWADIETANSWMGDAAANAADIQGGLDYLRAQGVPLAGIYSTGSQWQQITGGYQASAAPDWVAGALSSRQAAGECSSLYSFSGGPVRLTQYFSAGFDADYSCP
jgi:hypothetical protein